MLTGEQLRELGDSYVRAVRQLAPAAERIIDKMPYNFQYAGLIHLALSNARIIHVRRDLRDTALSCWIAKNGERLGQRYANELDLHFR